MKTLTTRVISATLAIAGFLAIYYFFRTNGLRFCCFIVTALGVRELIRILFRHNDSVFLKIIFAVFVAIIFVLTSDFQELAALGFACLSILFCSLSIVFEKRFPDLQTLSLFQAKSILGFFYVGLLPALACAILNLKDGDIWFFSMLAIVFAGDTFAYIFGLLWGNKKILPSISPKKTVIGSFGGLVGSSAAGLFCSLWLPHFPMWAFLPLALLTGIVAQLGDLFESMLKRVANIKDSGTLMPGHGGVLDRVDGVLFGAPIVLLAAQIFEKVF